MDQADLESAGHYGCGQVLRRRGGGCPSFDDSRLSARGGSAAARRGAAFSRVDALAGGASCSRPGRGRRSWHRGDARLHVV